MSTRVDIKKYFDIQELVCRHAYTKWGEDCWLFLDDTLLDNLLWLRKAIKLPIFINNWQVGGNQTQRGLRCNRCDLVYTKSLKQVTYVSAHAQGKAVDMTIGSMIAKDARKWIMEHANDAPHPFRLEDGVSWVHMDVRPTNTFKKCTLFRA